MSKDRQGERRAYFRLWYPEMERPTVTIAHGKFEVLELSEEGARIKLSGEEGLALGQPFAGHLRFRDGATVAIEGVVARVDGDQGALLLPRGVSLNRMLAEQRQILQRHVETEEDRRQNEEGGRQKTE
jgi:hypothetical protein